MTRGTGKYAPRLALVVAHDPAVKPVSDWLPPNQGFLADFRQWLRQSSYSPSALNIYSVATRIALGLLNKPYWTIDLDVDLGRVEAYLAEHFPSAATRTGYHQGVLKLAQYLRLRCHRPAPEKLPSWDHYLRHLSASLADDIRRFIAHRRRNWPLDRQRSATNMHLHAITPALRWMLGQAPLKTLADVTPKRWYAYVDFRLAAGIQTRTLNLELTYLQVWLRFWAEQDRPICRRFLQIEKLIEPPRLPRDVPVPQLRQLLRAIETEAASSHASRHRGGVMDRAWVLLMLHCGLRTSEVRRLKLTDIDWERRLVRVEQSKGLKDRLVPLSPLVLQAFKAYLAVRGPEDALPEQLFINRHLPLGTFYCWSRLGTYGERAGFTITPHQLRHSCATLLLNAGAPILTVQTILGHRHIETTLGYARLYDGTIAADYYRAMMQVEQRMALPETAAAQLPSHGELLALVDSLRRGTLNKTQAETVNALRVGLTALAERAAKGKKD